MAAKFLIYLVIAAVVSQGHGVQEIFLPDQTVNYISNPLIGTSMSIAKFWFDTLQACYVTFPNGMMYEAYPINRIPHNNIFYLEAVAPFNSCAIGFRGVGEDASGTYELRSLVKHSDDTQSLTRQRFQLNVRMSEVEFPTK